MSTYTIHFIVSIVLAILALTCFRKRLNQRFFVLGLLIVPILSYSLFYNSDYSLIANGLVYSVGYGGACWLLLLYFFFASFKRDSINEDVRKAPIKIAFLLVAQAVAIVFLCAIPWAFDTFPLSSVDSVLFTLFAPVEGAGEFVISSLKDQVVITGCQTFLLLIAAQIFGSVILFRKRIGGSFHLGPLYSAISSVSSVGTKFVQIQKIVCKALFGCVVVDLLLVPSILLSPELEALLGESIDSEFYKNRYVDPAGITAPEKGTSKNLVVVFVESMTNNYKAYTPELNEWQSKGLGFFPGSESVSGTGWTIAGITAALCGLPLNMPMGIGEYHGSLPTYLPNAVCLMDILHEQGYNQMFVQGTSAEFTQKRKFWTTHGQVEVHDELHYKKQGKVPENYHVFWGIEDEKTLSYAREDLDSLSKRNSPFAFYLLTVDTHQPNGYVDESCNYSEDTPFKNALRCTSNKVGKFLSWMEEQPWFKNTIVLVVGDHTQQMLSEKAGLPKDEKLYAMSFLLNVSTEDISFNRGFSNLDYTPTLLEALGWRIPDHGFALGRSLISNETTMLEMFGRDSLDVLLRQRSIQYNYFLYGK